MRTRTKYTPGPWTAGTDYPGVNQVFDTKGRAICDASDRSAGVPARQRKANTRLLAVAPELLVALEDALSWNSADLRNLEDITPNEDMLKARGKVLRAAIRAAKGA